MQRNYFNFSKITLLALCAVLSFNTYAADEGDIFFSKYFESASNVKGLAIYNGSYNYRSLEDLRIRIFSNSTSSDGIVTFSKVDAIPSELAPKTELLLYSYNASKSTHEIENNLEAKDIEILKNAALNTDIDKWICVSTTGNGIKMSGKNVVVLERLVDDDWTIIDIIGATDGQYNRDVVAGDYFTNAEMKTKLGSDWWGDDDGWYCETGLSTSTGEQIGLSTNRCLLVRNSNVINGYNSVEKNTKGQGFVTLAEEWTGEHIKHSNNRNEDIGFAGSGFATITNINNYVVKFFNHDNVNDVDTLLDVVLIAENALNKIPEYDYDAHPVQKIVEGEDWIFEGWRNGETDEIGITELTGNPRVIEYYAVFRNSCSFPYSLNINISKIQEGEEKEDNYLSAYTVNPVSCDDGSVVIAATDGWYYKFLSWSNGSLKSPDTLYLTKDSTITAKFVYVDHGDTLKYKYTEDGYAYLQYASYYKDVIDIPETTVCTALNNSDAGSFYPGELGRTYTVKGILGKVFFDSNKKASKVTEIHIPKTVSDINHAAFQQAEYLKAIIVDADNDTYKSVDGILFSKDGTQLLSHPAAKAIAGGEYIIPDGVTAIGKHAFTDCKNLKSIDLSGLSMELLPDASFARCSNLTDIILPEGMVAIDSCALRQTGFTAIPKLPSTLVALRDTAFERCPFVTIDVPNTIKIIGYRAFYHNKARTPERITIGQNVDSIADMAFYNQNAKLYINKSRIPAKLGGEKKVFGETQLSDTLYVPCGAVDAYMNSDWANAFAVIKDSIVYDVTVLVNDAELGTYKAENVPLSCSDIDTEGNLVWQYIARTYDYNHGVFDHWEDLNGKVLTTDSLITLFNIPTDTTIRAVFNKTYPIYYTLAEFESEEGGYDRYFDYAWLQAGEEVTLLNTTAPLDTLGFELCDTFNTEDVLYYSAKMVAGKLVPIESIAAPSVMPEDTVLAIIKEKVPRANNIHLYYNANGWDTVSKTTSPIPCNTSLSDVIDTVILKDTLCKVFSDWYVTNMNFNYIENDGVKQDAPTVMPPHDLYLRAETSDKKFPVVYQVTNGNDTYTYPNPAYITCNDVECSDEGCVLTIPDSIKDYFVDNGVSTSCDTIVWDVDFTDKYDNMLANPSARTIITGSLSRVAHKVYIYTDGIDYLQEGNRPDSVSVECDSSLCFLYTSDVPVGKRFDFYLNPELNDRMPESFTMPNDGSDLNLYKKISDIPYTIEFDNDTIDFTPERSYIYGQKIELPQTLKDGYSCFNLDGYQYAEYEEPAVDICNPSGNVGGEPVLGEWNPCSENMTMPAANIVIKPIITKLQGILQFQINGEESPELQQTLDCGELIKQHVDAAVKPTETGNECTTYDGQEWTLADGSAITDDIAMTAAGVVVNIVPVNKKFSVSFMNNGNVTIDNATELQVECEGEIDMPSLTFTDCYKLDKWQYAVNDNPAVGPADNAWQDLSVSNNAATMPLHADIVIRPVAAKESYNIVFENYNGQVLQSGLVTCGETPAYDGTTPIRPADAQYSYEFIGWSPEIVAVAGAATYTAQYRTTINNYNVHFYVDGEEVTGAIEAGYTLPRSVEYGTRLADVVNCYSPVSVDPCLTFDGQVWKLENNAEISQDAVVTQDTNVYITSYNQQFNVSFTSNDNVILNADAQQVICDGEIQIPQPAFDNCYELDKWQYAVNDNPTAAPEWQDLSVSNNVAILSAQADIMIRPVAKQSFTTIFLHAAGNQEPYATLHNVPCDISIDEVNTYVQRNGNKPAEPSDNCFTYTTADWGEPQLENDGFHVNIDSVAKSFNIKMIINDITLYESLPKTQGRTLDLSNLVSNINWYSDDVDIVNNAFTMPCKDITIVGKQIFVVNFNLEVYKGQEYITTLSTTREFEYGTELTVDDMPNVTDFDGFDLKDGCYSLGNWNNLPLTVNNADLVLTNTATQSVHNVNWLSSDEIGATICGTTQNVGCGTQISTLAAPNTCSPYKAGYTFNGIWVASEDVMGDNDITMTPQFTENGKAHITYIIVDEDGNRINDDTNNGIGDDINIGMDADIKPVPQNTECLTYSAWRDAQGVEQSRSITMIDGGINLYSTRTDNKFNVSFMSNENVTLNADAQQVICDGEIALPTASLDFTECFEFDKWQYAINNNPTAGPAEDAWQDLDGITLPEHADIIIRPVVTKKTFNVHFFVDNEEVIGAISDAVTLPRNVECGSVLSDVITCYTPETDDQCMTFDGQSWTLDGGVEIGQDIEVTQDINVYITAVSKQFNVALYLDEDKTQPFGRPITFNCGAEITGLPAPEGENVPTGQHFVTWNAPATMPAEDIDLVAEFADNDKHSVVYLLDGNQYGAIIELREGEQHAIAGKIADEQCTTYSDWSCTEAENGIINITAQSPVRIEITATSAAKAAGKIVYYVNEEVINEQPVSCGTDIADIQFMSLPQITNCEQYDNETWTLSQADGIIESGQTITATITKRSLHFNVALYLDEDKTQPFGRPITFNCGAEITGLPAPEGENVPIGQHFVSWNAPATMPAEDIDLVAEFADNDKHSVVYLLDGNQYGTIIELREGEQHAIADKIADEQCTTYSDWSCAEAENGIINITAQSPVRIEITATSAAKAAGKIVYYVNEEVINEQPVSCGTDIADIQLMSLPQISDCEQYDNENWTLSQADGMIESGQTITATITKRTLEFNVALYLDEDKTQPFGRPITFNCGAEITGLPAPEGDDVPTGQHFVTWNAPATMPAEDIDLVAQFADNDKHTVVYLLDGNQYGAIIELREGEQHAIAGKIADQQCTTYSDWSCAEAENGIINITAQSPARIEITATSEIRSFNVTLIVEEAQYRNVIPVQCGEAVQLPADLPTKECYSLVWDKELPQQITGDIVLNGSFNQNINVLTINGTNPETEQAFNDELEVGCGDDFNALLADYEVEGYELAWVRNDGQENATMPDADLTISITYTLTEPVVPEVDILTFEETICETELPYCWNNLTISEAGTYPVLVTNEAGAQELHILTLNVNRIETIPDTQSACESYIWKGVTYTQSGIYSYQDPENPCIVYELNLTISDAQDNNLSYEVCSKELPYTISTIAGTALEEPIVIDAFGEDIAQLTIGCTTYHISLTEKTDGCEEEPELPEYKFYAVPNWDDYGKVTIHQMPLPSNGNIAVVEAEPFEGYAFIDWDDHTLSQRRSIKIFKDSIVVANFYKPQPITEAFNITLQTDHSGIGTLNAYLQLNAVPYEGYLFHSWSDGTTDAQHEEIAINRDIAIEALFVKDRSNDDEIPDNQGNNNDNDDKTDNSRHRTFRTDFAELINNKLTGVDDVDITQCITVTDGQIIISGHEGESMQVYTVVGQLLYDGKITGQTTAVSVRAHSVYLVKINNQIAKVVTK